MAMLRSAKLQSCLLSMLVQRSVSAAQVSWLSCVCVSNLQRLIVSTVVWHARKATGLCNRSLCRSWCPLLRPSLGLLGELFAAAKCVGVASKRRLRGLDLVGEETAASVATTIAFRGIFGVLLRAQVMAEWMARALATL